MRRKHPYSRPRKPEVYFILQRDTNMLKIGFTTDIGMRLDHLQLGSAFDLICLGTIHDPEKKLEDEMHIRFNDYAVRGEWFRMEGELFQFIKDQFEARPERDKGAGWVFTKEHGPVITLGNWMKPLGSSGAATT